MMMLKSQTKFRKNAAKENLVKSIINYWQGDWSGNPADQRLHFLTSSSLTVFAAPCSFINFFKIPFYAKTVNEKRNPAVGYRVRFVQR